MLEALIVVVVVGILAGLALVRFGNAQERAYRSTMQSDLRNFATARALHLADGGSLDTGPESLSGFSFSQHVFSLGYHSPSEAEWSLVVGHQKSEARCGVYTHANSGPQRILCGEASGEDGLTASVNGAVVTFSALTAIEQMAFAGEAKSGAAWAARPEDIGLVVWEFGDGTTASGTSKEYAQVRHEYKKAGTYTTSVTLVSRNGNLSKSTQTVEVPAGSESGPSTTPGGTDPGTDTGTGTGTGTTTDPAAPVIIATSRSETGSPLRVKLLDGGGYGTEYFWVDARQSYSPSGTLASATYDWGDGSPLETVLPSSPIFPAAEHVYNRPGTFTVRLTLTDQAGLSSPWSRTITIYEDLPVVLHSAWASTSNSDPAAPAQTTFRALETVCFWYNASDQDGVTNRPINNMYVIWSFPVGALTSNITSTDGFQADSQYPYCASFQKAGIYTVGLAISDDRERYRNTSLQVTINP